jgi:phage terminase large subunit-like protein
MLKIEKELKGHPAFEYAKQVVSGKIPACKSHKASCKRFLTDLKTAGKRGFYLDIEAGDEAIEFIETFCVHIKGEWAGTPLSLEPWQQFIVFNLFGWKRKSDDCRRFRTAYIEVPRKNGKSSLAAAIGLYMLVLDGEEGAEIYSAATKRDQAKIIFDAAKAMVQKSPSLKKKIGTFTNNLHITSTASKFEPLAADSQTMDGLNIHCALVDEVHAHKTSDVWDVLETATGARRQSLLLAITTAGFNRQTVCFNLHQYTQKVAEGSLEDDTFFGIIFSIDEKDKWDDPKAWAKANPNLGISVKLDDIERLAFKAKEIPAAQNAFRRLRLNEWTEQENRWLEMTIWDRVKDAEWNASDITYGYGGLDLGSTGDIAALGIVLPLPDGRVVCKARMWVPEENIDKRVHKDRVPYNIWAEQGWLTLTPGNIIDYNFIHTDIMEIAEELNLREIAFDRWNATQLTTNLAEEGITMVPFGQGYASMAAPTKEFETLLLSEKLLHGDNPVLNWMASNVAVRADPAGNRKPDKSASHEKIDGIVGIVMALGRLIVHENTEQKNPYAERGVLVV